MIPWQLLDSAQVPGENQDVRLYQRGGEFSIRVEGSELMNSRVHGSEDAMAELACARIASLPCPQAELVPAVVAWNQGPLAALAGRPLDDDRVTIREVDVAQILQAEHQTYDAILLDVDNGPRGLTRKSNDWLYTRTGLDAAFTALRPAGVFALWSASPNRAFVQLLRKTGFEVDEERVRARGPRGGGYHTIWITVRVA